MKEVSTREVWRAVLGELQLQLPRATFETWLKQTEGVACDGQSFIVEVPTPFAVAWLERRMYQSIQKTVEKITQLPLDIQFQVKNGTSHRIVDPLPRPLATNGDDEFGSIPQGRVLEVSCPIHDAALGVRH